MRISTQNIACSQLYMPYIIQCPIMSRQPANKAAKHLTSSHAQYRKRKQKQSMIYKEQKEIGREEEEKDEGVGGWGTLTSSRKDWAEFYGCIKQVSIDQSLQWQSFENLSLSLPQRDRKLEHEERDTYRQTETERHTERQSQRQRDRDRKRETETGRHTDSDSDR